MIALQRFAPAYAVEVGRKMPIVYPSFELQAGRSALASLGDGIASFKVEGHGTSVGGVWLRDAGGRDWLITADQRDLRPLFEVFMLGIESIDELRARWREWKAPVVPPDMPEPLRQMMTTRPSEPVVPTDFRPWPLKTIRVDVLRRAEFIVKGVDVAGTVGDHPNSQSADLPGHVPDEASASCEVAAGLLFTDGSGQRLLIGVDWMPMNLVFTQEADTIDAYLAPCERIGLSVSVA